MRRAYHEGDGRPKMNQRRKAQILTIAILGLALVIAVGRKQLWRSSATSQPANPQDVIYAMFDASRTGDVRRYLSSYSGGIRSSLEQSVRESGEDRFSRYLKESNSAIKGIAVSEPEPLSDRELKVRVEFVYQDRNEAQTMYLQKDGANWKITRLDGLDRLKTLIPYGTPVR
jgi:hypothetical protein